MRTYAGAETLYRAVWTRVYPARPDGTVIRHETIAGPYTKPGTARQQISREEGLAARWGWGTEDARVEKAEIRWEAV